MSLLWKTAIEIDERKKKPSTNVHDSRDYPAGGSASFPWEGSDSEPDGDSDGSGDSGSSSDSSGSSGP